MRNWEINFDMIWSQSFFVLHTGQVGEATPRGTLTVIAHERLGYFPRIQSRRLDVRVGLVVGFCLSGESGDLFVVLVFILLEPVHSSLH